ncbi:type IV pilus modification PilV family protein [Undibacterium fentianense]|uniref:Type II secretion system protein n=1 Tax=Undibacterium fentianense TaxID=2828728 RepID=A0A941E0E3_9BURK|nr:type II secretion system protein [Undibacterium fentianense]MBR7800060.1 type II secretion system protein [Undibacterium fentianense]
MQTGVTLVELIMFMVIIGIAVVGIMRIMSLTSLASTDPLREKQALAVAESLLEEIQLQSFTYCDPDDANAMTALNPGACASGPQGLGPTAGETRYGVPRFDHVADYHNFEMNPADPVKDMQGNVIAGLEAYTVKVTETEDLGGDRLQIDINVSIDNITVKLTGYRYRYAPRAIP